jgi:hypothetical protein
MRKLGDEDPTPVVPGVNRLYLTYDIADGGDVSGINYSSSGELISESGVTRNFFAVSCDSQLGFACGPNRVSDIRRVMVNIMTDSGPYAIPGNERPIQLAQTSRIPVRGDGGGSPPPPPPDDITLGSDPRCTVSGSCNIDCSVPPCGSTGNGCVVHYSLDGVTYSQDASYQFNNGNLRVPNINQLERTISGIQLGQTFWMYVTYPDPPGGGTEPAPLVVYQNKCTAGPAYDCVRFPDFPGCPGASTPFPED